MDASRTTVMYVDGDPIRLAIVCRFLELNNFSCKGVPSIQDAVDYLRVFLPDLILSDYDMPGRAGSAFRHYLLSIDHLKTIPFLYYSGSPALRYMADVERLGARVVNKEAGLNELLVQLRLLEAESCND